MSTKTYKELLAEQKRLDEEIAKAKSIERDGAIGTIREMMALYEIDAKELTARRGARVGVTARPKYRDPESGATWSGRGKAPRWIAGKDRKTFEV